MRRTSLTQRLITIAAVLTTTIGLTATAAHADTTGTLTGVLTTSGGAPVANAWVYANGPSSWASGVTGSDGVYSIAGLAPGQYRVLFQPQGHPVQWAYGKTSSSEANVFEVAAGQTTIVNDTLLPTGTISGRFVTSSGAGVSYAYVTAMPMAGGSSGNAVTGIDGSYSMLVAPGQYRISFRAQSGSEQWAYGKTGYSEADIITVTAGQITTVNDTMLPTGSLSGTVRTAAGDPVAGVGVTAYGYSSITVSTDSNGRYHFAGLRGDEYRVQVRLSSGMSMWAPQALSYQDAGTYRVTPDQETTLDLTLLPRGAVSGRFTDNGVGIANVDVEVRSVSGEPWASTRTDALGNYALTDVFGGDYKVRFSRWQAPRIWQYAYGKAIESTADVITVVPDTTVTVNDTLLPTGSVRFTARDALTGAQIPEFWVTMGIYEGLSSNGALTFSEVAQGTHSYYASASGYQSVDGGSTTITAGRQTEVELRLRPTPKLDVTVVDAVTGQPVTDACAIPVDPRRVRDSDGCARTDANGRLSIEYLSAGDVSLLVLPPSGSGYGAQWVGPNGGTGDQREAAVIKLTDGQRSTAPTVRLDRAGTVTGRLTSDTGNPLQNASVNLITVTGALGGEMTRVPVAADGRYTIDWLGPYQWPLQFKARGHASQWSGTSPSRYRAEKIQIRSGTTTTYDYVMRTGTKLTGKVYGRDGAELANGRIAAFSPDTGDYAAEIWVYPGQPFELWALNPSLVKLTWEQRYWYTGTSFESSGVLPVGRAHTYLGLCVVSNTTMHFCPNR